MMNWSKPELVEINMSAEVGAYQDDSSERDEPPLVSGTGRQPNTTYAYNELYVL